MDSLGLQPVQSTADHIVLPVRNGCSATRDQSEKMSNSESWIESVDDLRALVTKTLCDHEHLEPGAFRLFERTLHRRGRPCGIQFCLAGPRAVRLTAFWEAEEQTVLFYDSTGERFRRVELTGHLPELIAEEQAA